MEVARAQAHTGQWECLVWLHGAARRTDWTLSQPTTAGYSCVYPSFEFVLVSRSSDIACTRADENWGPLFCKNVAQRPELDLGHGWACRWRWRCRRDAVRPVGDPGSGQRSMSACVDRVYLCIHHNQQSSPKSLACRWCFLFLLVIYKIPPVLYVLFNIIRLSVDPVSKCFHKLYGPGPGKDSGYLLCLSLLSCS